MRTGPYTSMAAAPGTQYSGLANLMAMQGTGGDNTLVHMSKSELPYLNSLARSAGHPQGLPVNPKTGLPEANILKTILPIAGTILGTMFLGPGIGTAIGSKIGGAAIGAGLGSFGGSLLAGRSLKDAAIGGLISGGLSGLSAGMFGGEAAGLGDTVTQGTAGAANQATVGAGLEGFADLGGAQISQAGQLGAFGMPEAAGAAGDLSAGASGFSGFNFNPSSLAGATPQGTLETARLAGLNLAPNVPQLTITGGPTGLGTAGSEIANVQNAINPLEGFSGENAFRTFGTAAPYPGAEVVKTPSMVEAFTPHTTPEPLSKLTKLYGAPPAVTTGDIQRAYVDQGIFDKAPSLREGYTPNVKDLRAINQMSEPSYLSPIQQYNPEGPLTRMDFLKTQLKPAATQAGVMLGIDALMEQGAFEPIDYSSYPTGEENKVSPLPLRGLKFESERTGAFPTTTAEALAFAQPGGNRQRFFNQRFALPFNEGGGLEDLEVKTFFGGGDAGGGDDSGPGDAGDAGDSGESDSSGVDGDDGFDSGFDGSEGGGEFSGFGGESGGLGGVSGGVAGAAAAAAADAMAAEQAISIPTSKNIQNEFVEEDILNVLSLAHTPPSSTVNPADEMIDFNPVTRADIASKLGGRAVNPGLSFFGYQTDYGRGPFGGYTSSDALSQQADIDQGFETAPVGSFSPFGFVADVGKTAANIAVPGLGYGITAVQNIGQPTGTGALGALSNVLGDEEGATTKAQGGLVKMAQGGSFLEQMLAGGLAATDEAQDMLGKLPKSMTSLLGGASAPMLAEKFMGKPASDITTPPPPVRALEAPVQKGPPPTIDELEEMQNIAVMQQVLSGVPVEAQAGGLISAYAMGGTPSPYFEGRVMGGGDGMSDSISFSIEGQQPAILSRDEYVLPADIVSMMGNGSSDAGAEKIDSFINDFRVQKYGRSEQPPETRRGLRGVA